MRQRIRLWIAGHPVLAMLLLMFGIAWALLLPAVAAGIPLIPLPLLGAVFIAQLGSSIVVTWAADGRPAVRHLFGRLFRWRVNPAWYAFALLAIPVVSLLWTAVAFGGGAVHALFTDRTVILDYLSAMIFLPIINLWEETAWMGVIQARLQTYRGPLLAAVVAGPLFGLLHMPLLLGLPVGDFLISLTLTMLFAIPFRMLLGWIYNGTGGSILLVATMHATFDATNNTNLLVAAAPGQALLRPGQGAVLATVVALTIVALIVTRGRLGYRREASAPPASAVPVGADAQ